MSGVYLGVDAGNSKTVALLATEDGRIMGRGRGGGGDIYGAGGPEGAVQEVAAAVRRAAEHAGLRLDEITAAAFLLAGVDWPEDATFWRSAIAAELGELRRVSVRNDGFSLLRLGSVDGTGVSAVAGTGGAVAGRGPDGEFSLSFWIQQDLAATGLGAEALRAVIRADLGIDPPTALTPLLLAHFGAMDVGALLESFTRRVRPRSLMDRAGASRTVLAAAAEDDEVALRIVRDQTGSFADYITAAADRVGLSADGPFPIVLGGALTTSGHPLYREALGAAVRARLPLAEVRICSAPPVAGAVLEAMAEEDGSPPPGARARLEEAAHPEEFLLT